MDGDSALDAILGRLRALRSIAVDTAREAAPLVERVVRDAANAGTDVDGKPWITTKDGKRPLAGAASAITASAKGAAVEVVLTGHHVFHHFGTRRDPKRAILPESGAGMAPRIAEALREAARRAFTRATGGG